MSELNISKYHERQEELDKKIQELRELVIGTRKVAEIARYKAEDANDFIDKVKDVVGWGFVLILGLSVIGLAVYGLLDIVQNGFMLR